MKRKLQSLINSSKETPWISATKTRNSLLNDHLLDYLNNYQSIPESNSNGSFNLFIMNQGIAFEESIISLLKNKFLNSEFMQIGFGPEDAKDINKYNETVKAIKKGVPVIYQGVLRNPKNRTFGMPDLIVKGSHIKKIVVDPPIVEESWYYIIDIKFTTIYLSANGINILNSGSVPAFKAQLCIYKDCLNLITKKNNQFAFILARRWIQGSTGNTENTAFNKLGTIDYTGYDSEYIQKTKDAIKWYKSVLVEGKDWSLSPPTKPELYPNMKNDSDFPWRPFKKSLSESLGEITTIWQCGLKKRKIAHAKNITNWKKCTAALLGFNEKSKYYPIVNKILNINKTIKNIISPKLIKSNYNSWKQKYPLDFYVDYETISNVTDDFTCLPNIDQKSAIIFLIGCGYIDPIKGNWVYQYFIAQTISPYEEHRIITEWFNFMDSIKSKYSMLIGDLDPRLIHWGDHESSYFNNAVRRHQLLFREAGTQIKWNLNPNWLNFLKLVKEEPVVVNGAFNFSLKSIAYAMNKHGLIPSKWESECTNGLDAVIIGFNTYKKKEFQGNKEPIESYDSMKDIIKYNEYDCKLVYEIVNYLRLNHT